MKTLLDLKKALNEKAGSCPIHEEPENEQCVHPLPEELHGLVCLYHQQLEAARDFFYFEGQRGDLFQRYKKLAAGIKEIIDDCLRSHHGPPSMTGYKLYSEYRYGRVPLEE